MDLPALAAEIIGEQDPTAYPHLAAFTAEHVLRPGYAFADSFKYGLDLVLEGLAR